MTQVQPSPPQLCNAKHPERELYCAKTPHVKVETHAAFYDGGIVEWLEPAKPKKTRAQIIANIENTQRKINVTLESAEGDRSVQADTIRTFAPAMLDLLKHTRDLLDIIPED